MKMIASMIMLLSLIVPVGAEVPLGFEGAHKSKILAVNYFRNLFGHIHQNPSRYSQTLTTISCAQPVKVLQKLTKEGQEILAPEGWTFISVGPYEGYLQSENLSDGIPNCFSTRYSKFVEGMDLDLSEIYYWGRLYDQYVQGRSKVR